MEAWTSTSAARLLMSRILNCSSGERLLEVVKHHAAFFNHVHVPAALGRLAKHQPLARWRDDARTHLLVARAGELLGEMDARGLSYTAWACSKLGVTPEWLPVWIGLTTDLMATMDAFGLSNSVYALASLGHHPGNAWFGSFYAASLDMSTFKEQTFSNILYSLALLGDVPNVDWWDAFWAASSEDIESFSPQGLSNIIWAAATLHVSPPDGWLTRFFSASKESTTRFNARDYSQIIWALAVLRHRPSDAWLQLLIHTSFNQLRGFSGQELHNTLWGLAELAFVPGPDWFAAWSTRVVAIIDTLSSQNAVNSLWALTVFQMQNSGIFRFLFLQALRILTPDSDVKHLTCFYDVIQMAAGKVEGLPTPNTSLMEAAQKMHSLQLASTALHRASFNHRAVLAVLTELGIPHQQEHICPHAGRNIDIALLDRRVAVEVDGPSHFLSLGEYLFCQTGSTLLRNLMLTHAGWKVITIPFFEWNWLTTMDTQKEYFQRKLYSAA